MKRHFLWGTVFVLFLKAIDPSEGFLENFFVIPEDLPTALVGIYGFAPKLVTGKDSRVGFGFKLGNHADFQVLYEIGPQRLTRPIGPLRARSALYRERLVRRRRPLLDLLSKNKLLQEIQYKFDVDLNVNEDPGPR